MSSRIYVFLKEKIELLASSSVITILKNSMINIIPIIICGSFFLLFFSLFNGLNFLRDFYLLTMGSISLFLSASIGYNFAQQYNKDKITFSLVSLASFLIIINIQEIEKKKYILIKEFSADNMFLSIIVGLVSCYVFTFIYKILGKIFNNKDIPESVRNSLNSIFPFFITLVLVIWIFKNLNLKLILIKLLEPINTFGDSIITVILANLFLHIMNFFGIHGISIINSILLPLWQKYLVLNAENFTNHLPMNYITAYPFFQWFVWIGGAGSTLSLNILLLFSKNQYLKNIGKTSIVTSLFNINEPLLFGLPIIFNPYFSIPFILAPIITSIISYFAIYFNLVSKVYIEVPWFLPFFIGSYLSTSDYKAVILSFLNLFVSMIIYYPFLVLYTKHIENKEKSKIDTQN